MPSGQTWPCVAAVAQMETTALGPLSVKSAKKLLGRLLKTVSPSFTISVVTEGKGIVISLLRVCPGAPGWLIRATPTPGREVGQWITL